MVDTLSMLGLPPADTAIRGASQQPQGMGGFLQGDAFGNMLTAAGISLMSSPRNAPLSNFGQSLNNAQTATFRQQQADQEAAAREEEKQRRAELAEYALNIVHPSLRSLAQSQPEVALKLNEQMQPKGVDYGWQVINGQLVRTDSTGNATPMGQFGNQPRPMSQEERAAWGIPATDATPYFLDEDGTPTALGKGGVTVNNNMSGDKFGDAFGTKLGEQQAGLIDAARTAASNNIRLGQLETHLANAQQGVVGGLVQTAGRFGIPVDGLDDIQAAQAIINQMVPTQRPPGSGTMSDADLELYKASLPSIMNQPGGNAYIIQTTKAINDYYVQQGMIAERLAIGEITLAQAMEEQRNVPNPLAGFNGNGAGGPAVSGGPNAGTTSNGLTWTVK